MSPRISLEQWRALVAVVESGGYAQAAEQLHKTQSTVTYAVQKLQSLLGVEVFRIEGRKARLTPTGQVLYRRARALLDEAESLERASGSLAAGWEPELRLAVEIIFPTWLLLQCFASFAAERPETRLQLYETVLGGSDEALLEHRVDLAIVSHLPQGFVGDPLMRLRFLAVAHPQHPLQQLDRPLTLQDLRKHRQIVIRDSAQHRKRESGGWLGAEQRWTVSNKATSIAAVCRGLGFAWLPEETIREELDAGRLKPLPLREGGERFVDLYLVFADPDYAGPGARHMAELIRTRVAEQCSRADRSPAKPVAGRKRSHPRRKKRPGAA